MSTEYVDNFGLQQSDDNDQKLFNVTHISLIEVL